MNTFPLPSLTTLQTTIFTELKFRESSHNKKISRFYKLQVVMTDKRIRLKLGTNACFVDLNDNPIPSEFGGVVEEPVIEHFMTHLSEFPDYVLQVHTTGQLSNELRMRADELHTFLKKALEFYHLFKIYYIECMANAED